MPADRPMSGASLPSIAAIGLLVSAMPAVAGAADEPERPETWDMTIEQLREPGLGQYRGDLRPVPHEFPHERVPGSPPEFATQGRIFVNFDGATLSGGYDDSRSDITQIDELVGSFAAYGDGDKRNAVMQAVRADWAPFDMVVTDVRPGSGSYTMNMTGPTNPFGPGVLGIAPLDCMNMQTHSNITFAFHSVDDEFSAPITAT